MPEWLWVWLYQVKKSRRQACAASMLSNRAGWSGASSPNGGRPRSPRLSGSAAGSADRLFARLRARRLDSFDPETGEPMDAVFVLRTPDIQVKEALLSDRRMLFLTTAHFDGYTASLVRTRDLERIGEQRLCDVVALAWRSQAPTYLVREHDVREHDERGGAAAALQP